MTTIAGVVLTLNEEVNIERCLTSLGWCDELVVVDSGSTDRTCEIAARLGARVLEHQQSPPFLIAEQRNWVLEQGDLRSEWVLFLDADEEATDLLAKAIRRECSQGRYSAFRLAPKYIFMGQWMRRSMDYPSWHDRLLQKGEVRFAGGVWEHFVGTGSVGAISEPYLHYGDSKGFIDWAERHLRYAAWESEGVFSYLCGRGLSSFRTERKLRKRALAARFWRWRPPLRFFTMYILRRGFLDGKHALLFCLRYAMYEQMIVEMVAERMASVDKAR